ncbi:MAG: hypothetical protein KGL39_18515 [Patescibacteria group bacterium]|nr:hypothetical protein [Patescibacteria group bacterium]
MRWLAILLAIFGGFSVSGQEKPTLAAVLFRMSRAAGPAPGKYQTPFLVLTVAPVAGGFCQLQVVTNGMLYKLSAEIDAGRCKHLPGLHSFVWGRRYTNRLASIVAGAGGNIQPEQVELVYQVKPKVKAVSYFIDSSIVIGDDWGQ